MFSGDISLNPGPVFNNQVLVSNDWNVFKSHVLHLMHLNTNDLSKIDEIRYT